MTDLSRRLADLSEDKRSLLERVLRREGHGAALLPVRPRAAGTTDLPLAFGQESLWFMCQLASDSTLFNLPSAVRLTGRLDRAALERSLREIVRRHEILRTRFPAAGGRPTQQVLAEVAFPFPLVDLGHVPAEGREARARELALAEGRRSFDLAEGPLFRFSLLSLAADDHLLVIVFHHLVWDGWSIGVMSRELGLLYQAFSTREPSPLPDLPIQYADYTLWEREQLSGERLEEQLAYWRPRLAGQSFNDGAALPTDRPRPALPTFMGAVATISLPASLSAAVDALSARAGTTVFMTLLAAFQAVLARWSDSERVAVGTPVANRRRAEVEGLIGHFANLLVMATEISGAATFDDLLARVKETATGAYAHQDIPFELLVDRLQIERDPSKNPVFQVLFAVHMDRLDGTVTLPGLTVSPFTVSDDHSHFDLGLHLWRTSEGIAGYASYNRDLYHPATVARLIGHFRTLLGAAVLAPEKPLRELPMLTEDEQQALAALARRGAGGVVAGSLAERIEARAAADPEAVALAHGDAQVSYGGLVAAARKHGAVASEPGIARALGLLATYLTAPATEQAALLGRITRLAARLHIAPGERFLALANAPVVELLLPLCAGATVVLGPASTDPVQWAYVTTTALADLLASGDATARLGGALHVIAGGARLPVAVVDAFHRQLPARLFHLYSPPEAAAEVSLALTTPFAAPAAVPDLAPVHLLDRLGRPVPVGVAGVVHLADPDAPDVPRIPTADRAVWLADGALCLVGAEGRRVYRDGIRVDLDTVEAALLRHAAVDACRVVEREHDGREEVLAYVVPAGVFSAAPLLDHLRALLPPAAVPTGIVPLTALPRGADGLVDERALTAFPVVDAALIDRWRARIEAAAGSPARVITVDPASPQHIHHVSELLPGHRPARAVERTTTVSAGAVPAGLAGARPALADGGLLEIPADAPTTLPAALLRAAATWPDHGVRVVNGDGDDTFITYPALLRAARSVLTGLRAAGLGPGAQVILQITDLADYFAALWGCLLGGVVPVTVSTTTAYDRKSAVVGKLYNTWELLHRPPVLASAALAEPLAGVAALFRDDGERLRVLPIREIAAHPPADAIHPPAPDDLAFLQLTSGSTGVPKCIQETHRATIHHILGARQMHGFGPDQVHLNWLPMDHSVPILLCHLKDTYLGIQQVHAQPEVVLGDPLAWLDMMERYRVTHTWSPNFGYKLVNDALARNPDRRWDLSSFAYTMNGAEQATLPVAEEFLRRLAPFGVRPSVMTPAFGMAELATGITYAKDWEHGQRVYWIRKSSLTGVLEDAPAADPEAIPFVCLGKPLPGVLLRIVDADNRVLPERVIGVLQIRSPCVTRGYLYNDEANREVFVGDGWFSSGDLGFIHEGRLTITGRQKEMIVVRGANYYCYELEDAVDALPGVEPTFVAACSVDDPATGTDGLALFYVPKVEGIDLALIRSITEKITADFGVTPLHVLPIGKERFPKTTSGKVQRTQLKKDLLSGRFDELLCRLDVALENDNTVPDWFFRPAWARVEIDAAAPHPGGVLVLLDDAGLGAAIATRLGDAAVCVERGAGFARIAPRRYALRPGDRGDYDALVEALTADGITVDRILHLRTYGLPAAIASLAELEDRQSDGAADVLALVQALAGTAESRPFDLLVISSHTHRRGSGERVAYERAPVRGLVKSIPAEWPHVTARHVDLPFGEAGNEERVLREADGIGKDWEVTYRDGARLVRRLEVARLTTTPAGSAPPWKDGDLILLTGGLGGVGAVIARHLLEQHQARLVLIGRTPRGGEAAPTAAPDTLGAHRTASELRKTLADLERAGGAVVYEVADVTDGPRLQAIVARAEERFGARLAGVIHLAGVFPTRLLAEETTETLRDTLRPKLGGAFVLGELLRGRGFFLAFDTVYSFFGGVAVGAYAAANAGVEAFVEDDPGQRSSFAWSHWDETGLSRGYQLRAASRASGYSMIRPRQGLCSLLAGLARGERDLVIGLDARRPNVRRHLVAPPAPAERLAGYVAYPGALAVSGDVLDRFGTRSRCDVFVLDALPLTEAGELDRAFLEAVGNGGRAASADRVLPRSDLERTIAAAWREVLGIEVVDVHTSFFTLGGQSILLIQLLSKLKRSTGRDLTVVDLFRHPTVSALAAHLGTAAPGRPTYARAAERAKKQQEAARQRVSPRGERTGHR